MSKLFDVAVVGTAGIIGETLIELLAQREFPLDRLYPVAADNSAGGHVNFKKENLRIEELAGFDFSKVQLAFFCAEENIAAEHAPRAVESGCMVIDNSGRYCDDADVPLVIPEVNPETVGKAKRPGIIASPCSATILMLVALKPVYDAVGIKRIQVVTFQSVSDVSRDAVEEMAGQTARLLNAQPIEAKIFKEQIAFNLLPQIGELDENGVSRQEISLMRESRKILEDETIGINATAVRVPVFFGTGEAINIETRDPLSLQQAHELLQQAPGIELFSSDGGPLAAPTPVTDVAGQDAVFVARLRSDPSVPQGLNMWVATDNSRKGSALNSVQIGEILVKGYL